MLEIQKLNKKFGTDLILEDLTLRLPEGSIAFLLGHNGSGKSTLLKILSGLLRPDAGSIRLGSAESPRERRRLSSIFTHEHMLYEDLSLKDNFQLYGVGISPERCEEELDYWELSALMKKPVASFSAGQKARASLARTFLHQKDFLFLDEPSSALDDHFAKKLAARVLAASEHSKAILFASHDLYRMFELASSCLLLHGGSLVFQGTDVEQGLHRYQELNR